MEVFNMAKPSIFSNNYKERRKKRRINLFLFILLIISVSFFGGKYYLSKHDIPLVTNVANSKIVKNISHLNWISKIKERFSSKTSTQKAKSVIPQKNLGGVAATTSTSIASHDDSKSNGEMNTTEYVYHGMGGTNYYVKCEKIASKVEISSFRDESNTSEYSISKDKSKIVFDVKSENSLVICDTLGNFKVISRPDYKMKSTGKVIPKATILSEYKDYIWAQKPTFTLDGRIIYVSRLPYIRKDNTLYLWSMNVDGTNNKKISQITHDISKVSYSGYDDKNRLKVIVEGIEYYLDNGSYMLRKK
jgi:hypothetical protein